MEDSQDFGCLSFDTIDNDVRKSLDAYGTKLFLHPPEQLRAQLNGIKSAIYGASKPIAEFDRYVVIPLTGKPNILDYHGMKSQWITHLRAATIRRGQWRLMDRLEVPRLDELPH